MDDPMKIIFKFKNNNKRIQYHTYIFIGDIPKQLLSILNSIQDKPLYDSLIHLSKADYNKLVNYYGDHWYKKFFNTYHINNTIQTVQKNTQQRDEIIAKYSQEWYKAHIEEFKLIDRQLYYTYETLIKDEILRREGKRKKVREKEEEEKVDYRTVKKTTEQQQQTGGQEEQDQDDGYDYNKEADDDNDGTVEYDEGLDQDQQQDDVEEEEINDLEQIYKEQDVVADENIAQTTNLIKIALKDEDFIKKKKDELVPFDTSKDNLMFDDNLKNTFQKFYVTSQYIFKDDTVKMIKNKITCSIKNNPKFEQMAYIPPSRQYLWSEYYYNDILRKVMIGQKWIIRSDILQIDVEPNTNLRTYEELRGNLKLLRDNIKRYGSKIKWEDDDYNILYDYENYFTNNELYMVDIYNELGKDYNSGPEELKNLIDVYFKIYFRRIKSDDIKYILDYLAGDTKVESTKSASIFETLNNDLILENQIMYDVEMVKRHPDYKSLFKDNYITQSVIHVNLRVVEGSKIDLFRIFNEFITTKTYPFIQYQTADGQIIFKYSEEDIREFGTNKENIDVLGKWFENAPYGISFKVRIVEKGAEKFMGISLSDTGKIEYKTQWKEEDMATIQDIKKTYSYVRELITKLNSEKNKVRFDKPEDGEFKYAFINSIQKFELPGKFIINHNDLSEFSRYFYPYIALVIEPRKRQAKVKKETEKSKFGTYLRYKRVSKYENQARIEQRILYFMRNYDYTDQSLANEISKQFNITLDRAIEEIDRVRNKYPNIKKSRKVLKKLENIPKYKPPGIGIDIQGKQRDRYKIRISGARNKDQLDRIIVFMNILIHLYVETYLYKKSERQILKDKLKKLTNIASRRFKVDDIVNYEKETKTVKHMAQLDKKRIGFKPEKGQSQWTRACQNSGTDKKRRPQQILTTDDVIAQGFKLDKKTGIYEKKITLKSKKGKSREVLIRAAGLKTTDEEGRDVGTIYYTCNPHENGEHMFVGFLSRSNNPYGQCMPCCFKKDPYSSKNRTKKDYFLKCIGQKEGQPDKDKTKIVGDQLYILQDTNKIQEGRFGLLPVHLDFFLNQALGRNIKIKHHYLLSTKSGYFFKYGSKQEEFRFLNAIAAVFDKDINIIRNILIDRLERDKTETLFTAINNGDIKTGFKTRDNFINFIKNSPQLNYDIMYHIITLPGVLTPGGINLVIFDKKTVLIKKTLEKEKSREDFSILCLNEEEINNILDPSRDTIILLRELKNFYPIVEVVKKDDNSKTVSINKIFKYSKNESNIVYHISDFYIKNCQMDIIVDTGNKRDTNKFAKDVYRILLDLGDKDYTPRYQVVDARNKCKYILTQNSTIVPTKPSGSIYNLQIIKKFELKLLSLDETIDKLTALHKLSKTSLPVKPIGVYYSTKVEGKIRVVAVMTESYDNVPVKEENFAPEVLTKRGLIIEFKQLFDKIDEYITRGDKSQVDDRIEEVAVDKYKNESYELFRLEFSNFITQKENEQLRKKIEKIITSDSSKNIKKASIKQLLYRTIDKGLFNLYNEYLQSKKQAGGAKYDRFVSIINRLPDLSDYEIKNIRDSCKIYPDRDSCNTDRHCHWSYDNCNLALTRDMIITFINKISEELANNSLKASELLQREDYFVSDIVNYNKFTEREGQKIVKSTSAAINKVLVDLFGEEYTPKIGKRRSIRQQAQEFDEMNVENPLKDMGYFMTQKIIDSNLTIFRAYANGYAWVKHKYYELESRNLGYYSIIQTDMANYFRSIVVDWLTDKKNAEFIKTDLARYIESDKDPAIALIRKITKDITTTSNGVAEYYILSKSFNIPIVVYDDNNNPLYIFDNALLYDSKINSPIDLKKYEKQLKPANLVNSINIRFSGGSDIPIDVEVIYYK
jgi:hypothetical protein